MFAYGEKEGEMKHFLPNGHNFINAMAYRNNKE